MKMTWARVLTLSANYYKFFLKDIFALTQGDCFNRVTLYSFFKTPTLFQSVKTAKQKTKFIYFMYFMY